MSRNERIFLSISIGVSLLVCVLIPIVAFTSFNALKAIEPTASLLAKGTTAAPAAGTATAAPICGGPSSMFILLIGSDSRTDDYYAGLSDSMRIVRVDFVHPGLMFLAFQRDLYVEIPGISSHAGITHGKLNQAYLYGNPSFGYYNGPGQGPGLLALTLQQNFGARVDHYVAVNLSTFVRVVDTLGGIDIDLPYSIDGRTKGSPDQALFFPAGRQHLDGTRAMMLARLRPNGDLQRSTVQDIILRALAAKILAPGSLPQLPKLVEAFYTSIQTDLGAADLAKLLCLGSKLDAQEIQSVDFPPELFTPGRLQDPVLGYTFAWDVDFNLLRAYVQYFNNGTWPKTPLAEP